MWRHGVVTSIVRFLCGEDKEQVEEECKENSSNKHCIVNYQPYVYVYQREGRKEGTLCSVSPDPQIQSVDII